MKMDAKPKKVRAKTDGIEVWVLGDFGPFSRAGKSIGYMVSLCGSRFLVDCGAPLFNLVGGHGLKDVDGLIITHCHDDHKRWFTDLALFYMYAPDITGRVSLVTSEEVNDELVSASAPSIDRSLSVDSKTVVDIAYEDYIDTRLIGPSVRYKIVTKSNGGLDSRLAVVDSEGNVVGPEKAKIVINPRTGRPRMLFRDPDSGEWVEPESYYSFSSNVFYTGENRIYKGDGFEIEAVKAPVWHGISGIGIRFSTENDKLFFTSDTVHDVELWEGLYNEKRPQKLECSRSEFESLEVIHGDINDYIERTWSESRYKEAMECFGGSVVFQDVSLERSVVHTDYVKLDKTLLDKERSILTHCPDRMTSEWVLCFSDKVFRVVGDRFYEVVGEKIYPMNADVYHKENGRYYVGYKNENGTHKVYEQENALYIQVDRSEPMHFTGRHLYSVDLYEDIGGEYFPVIEDPDVIYYRRKDGKVERIRFTKEGSTGEIVKSCRNSVCKPLRKM